MESLKESLNNSILQVTTSLSDKFSSSLNVVSHEVTSLKTQVSASQLNKVPHNLKDTANAIVTKTNTPSKIDRSANVIFFGIPEQDILHCTRSLIDEACVHLVGKDIPI